MSSHEGSLPVRPMLTPLFVAALGAWLGVVCAEDVTWRIYIGSSPISYRQIAMAVILLGVFCSLFLVVLRKVRPKVGNAICRSGLVAGLMGLAMAFACACFFWHGWSHDIQSLPDSFSLSDNQIIELTGDPSMRDYGTISTAQIRVGPRLIRLRVIWPEETDAASAGHQIIAQGTLRKTQPEDSGRWAHQNGYVATLKAEQVQDAGVPRTLQGTVAAFRDDSFARISSLGGDAASLLAGITLGNRTLFAGTELEQAFQTTGLAHLMAVSGTHLAVVTAILMMLLSRTPLRRMFRSAILLASLIIYVALTAFSPSAMRACIMCATALLAGVLKRRKSVLNGLALCAFLFLGTSPMLAFSMGFQLSTLAVLGLVVFGPLFHTWLEHFVPSRFEFLMSSIAATLAATLMTLPVTIPQFAQLPLVSPLANILAAPLVTAALSLGMIGLLLGTAVAPIGSIILHGAGTIANACSALVRVLSALPGACIPVSSSAGALGIAFAAMAIALWVIWPLPREAMRNATWARRNYCLASLIIILPLLLTIALGFGGGLGSLSPVQSRVVMLDVGQGDSMLISSLGANVLVDTGEKGDVLLRQLAQQGVTHLDAVVITHKDADHAGALSELAGVVSVEHVYVHEDLLAEDFEEKVLEAARWVTNERGAEGVNVGTSIRAGEFRLSVLSPLHGGQSGNENSLVSLLEYDAECDGAIEARGLLTGDAESEAVADAVKRAGDIDFLKVAHHGSKGGLTDEELSTLKPEIALISVGAKNRYGHPTTSTLRQLETAGAKVYRTDKQGAVTLGFSANGISVMTEK